MNWDWKEYLKLAEVLSGSSNDEAKLRTAVSRTYYAVFNIALNFARNENYYPPKNDVHLALIDYFRNRKFTPKFIANYLETLRGWRNNVDYDSKVENLQDNVRSSFFKAKALIKELDKLAEKSKK